MELTISCRDNTYKVTNADLNISAEFDSLDYAFQYIKRVIAADEFCAEINQIARDPQEANMVLVSAEMTDEFLNNLG